MLCLCLSDSCTFTWIIYTWLLVKMPLKTYIRCSYYIHIYIYTYCIVYALGFLQKFRIFLQPNCFPLLSSIAHVLLSFWNKRKSAEPYLRDFCYSETLALWEN